MAPKAKGRPRTKAATENLKDQDNAKSDQSTDKATETNEQDLANQEKIINLPMLGDDKDAEIENLKAQLEKAKKTDKVVDVKVNTQKTTRLKPSEQRKITHTVIFNGKEREWSKQTYDVMTKDPKQKIELPRGSRLVEPELDKPCKDC